MIWVVVADSTSYRLFNYAKYPQHFELLKEISHPELRLRKEEYLTSDKPGHYKSSSANRGAFSPRTDPKDVEINNFARVIAHELDQGRNQRSYDSIILIVPAHMLGLLNHHFDKHVKDMVIDTLQKDLSHLKPHELVNYLESNSHTLKSLR